jgi:hypothetical protein
MQGMLQPCAVVHEADDETHVLHETSLIPLDMHGISQAMQFVIHAKPELTFEALAANSQFCPLAYQILWV